MIKFSEFINEATPTEFMDALQKGNKDIEGALLDAGIKQKVIDAAKKWAPPAKLTKDIINVGNVLKKLASEDKISIK